VTTEVISLYTTECPVVPTGAQAKGYVVPAVSVSSAIVAQIIGTEGSSATPIPGYASAVAVSSQVYTQGQSLASSPAVVPGSTYAAPYVTAQPSVFASSSKGSMVAGNQQNSTSVVGATSTYVTAGAAGLRVGSLFAVVAGALLLML